jgi:hypothetical protein
VGFFLSKIFIAIFVMLSLFPRFKFKLQKMPITCACATELASISNLPCDATPFGNQIVKLFLQKMAGSPFDGAAIVGTVGGDISLEADWDAKLAAVGDDKIVIIPNLAGAVKESTDPNIEEGNDVPYDGADIIDRTHTITFDMKYMTAASFAEIDQFSCPVKYRLYYLDNNDYLWMGDVTTEDGVSNVSVVMTSYGQAGIGTKNKFAGNIVRWNSLEGVQPSATQLPFLATK